ncbi:MAG: hypothetical protein RIR62_1087 [Pseudomonadota bacterium]
MSDEMDEIWALYADDGAQALDAMETALDALGAGPVDATDPQVAAFFRAVHTFKGNSRVLGLSVVESRAHLSEDLIGLVRDQGVPWDGEIRDVLLMATDVLRAMLEETAATRADVAPDASEGLMARLADKIARCTGQTGTAPEAVTPPVTPPEDAPAEEAPSVEASAIAEPASAPEPEPEAAPTPAAPKVKARKAKSARDDAAPAAAPAPEPASEPVPVAATPGAATPAAPRLADDPAYRAIFDGMVRDALAKLQGALATHATDPVEADTRARREADGLAHAARQMGLPEWEAPLRAFLSAPERGSEPIAQLILRLQDLGDSGASAGLASPDTGADDHSFFDRLQDPLRRLARIGADYACGQTPDPAEVAACVDAVIAGAGAQGYIRVVERAEDLRHAASGTAFREAELRLYEELAAVEAVMPDAARAAGISPRGMVQEWCAEHVFDTLSALEATLSRLRQSAEGDKDALYSDFDRRMRLVRHACAHHRIETAGQLALTLVDLFARAHASGKAPDPILNHIARGFIDTVELVFDALHQGEEPDTANLDRLFEEAANMGFVKDGLATATAIERRLGLPKEFHRVLSPESVRAASECIEQGHTFFVLRADINDDEALAERFIDWLSSGVARSITNVTVFRGTSTLFDFLIAAPMGEADFVETMARIDPTLKKLVPLRTMQATEEQGAADGAGSDADGGASLAQSGGVTAEMLETLGEIAANQSMVSHILTQLAETDLTETVDTVLRAAGGDMRRARAQLLAAVGDYTARLKDCAQIEAQLSGKLAQLQEETVEIRSRRIETVLRPLETFVQTYSRRNRSETRFSSSGGELSLDVTILDTMRRVLRSLVMFRLDQAEGAPAAMHVAFQRDEERVLALLEDDGAAVIDAPVLDDIRATLQKLGGDIRAVALPGRGMRHHITVPLAMVVLEGMVVGVEGVRYVMPVDAIRMILQPEQDVRLRISAAGGREMLRIAPDEMVAVAALGSGQDHPREGRRGVYVVLGAQGRSVAVPVDELIGQQLVLLRPLKGVLSRINNMNGIALLAGGDVGMVVSPSSLCMFGQEAPPQTYLGM